MTTPLEFLRAKSAARRLTMVTCYDFTFATLLARSPIDAILVGDSAAMVMHGEPNTLPATVEMIGQHTRAVVRGAPDKFVVADMPFLSHRKGIAPAVDAAQSLLTAGAHAVKLEGLDGHEDVVQHLVQSGIPVMGHLGMQPQSVRAYGGFKAQGRAEAAAAAIARQAQKLEQLGAFAVVLECIPAPLARSITAALRIPTIGIGAGPACDGQILVLQDLLGLNPAFRPRFARPFLDGAALIAAALTEYDNAVKSADFPNESESFH
jgi:3-methyl-2-oxobutanoate hydroxymethyltransferase